ncbi:NifB/NifX family molybdenum-iron cluster-binding protein [Geoalkalibacter subterraneus]|uniref:Dinitrogenase iron-molybdenum cofactor biosynthesis domain-containing protein n=1 Tax=Geoalkalibacter subterraneus TaxID=483547 RepID=A0A0B5FV31_9BACT|nr:NifB/NifX family molybdenum-iron cluster-binding protein [Geoalkalibacter subterraneus]AJF07476.1 hypothetical protein GSUB_14220 [Geoalkalibacter subterraneus]
MIIAVTSLGNDSGSPVDARFGRAAWFLLYDDQAQSWEPLENSQGQEALQGAGIQAAQQMASRGVAVLITGTTGPKAQQALKTAGIKIYHGAKGSVAAALDDYKKGRLEQAA